MKCPKCSLINPDGTQRCDCGYAFQGPQTDSTAPLVSIERSVRTIKNIVVWWFVLTLIGAVVFVIVRLWQR
jgi:hypothetical protein